MVSALWAMPASAGTDVSGGGNALVCFESPAIPAQIHANGGNLLDEHVDQLISIETYDLIDAASRRGIDEDAVAVFAMRDGEKMSEFLERLAQVYGGVSPRFSAIIRDGMQTFSTNNIIRQAAGVQKINDVNPGGLVPRNCVLATVAVQTSYKNTIALNIDERLYNHPKFSLYSKAVLLLHEFVYFNARSQGAKDSGATRQMVALLLTAPGSLTVAQVIEQARSLEFLNPGGFLEAEKRFQYPKHIVGYFERSYAELGPFYGSTQLQVIENAVNELTQLSLDIFVAGDDQLNRVAREFQELLIKKYEINGKYGKCGRQMYSHCLSAAEEALSGKAKHRATDRAVKISREDAVKLRALIYEATQAFQPFRDRVKARFEKQYTESTRPKLESMPGTPIEIIEAIDRHLAEKYLPLLIQIALREHHGVLDRNSMDLSFHIMRNLPLDLNHLVPLN